MIYMKSDQVSWNGRGSAEVGQYSVAVRVAESLYFLPIILLGIRARIGKVQVILNGSRIASALSICLALGVGMMLSSMWFCLHCFHWYLEINFCRRNQHSLVGPAAFAWRQAAQAVLVKQTRISEAYCPTRRYWCAG